MTWSKNHLIQTSSLSTCQSPEEQDAVFFYLLFLASQAVTINKTPSAINHYSRHSWGETQAPEGSDHTTEAAQDKYSPRSGPALGTILARWQWCLALRDPLTSEVPRVSLMVQCWADTPGARASRAGLQPRDRALPLPQRHCGHGRMDVVWRKRASLTCAGWLSFPALTLDKDVQG